jgi:flagellin
MISETVRAPVRGLHQAARNAQEGLSLVQTAEQALGQVQTLLQRMREFAAQAVKETLPPGDRPILQVKMDQLIEEIDRLANTTEFNAQVLLDGSFASTPMTLHIGARREPFLGLTILEADSSALDIAALDVTNGSAASAALSALEAAISRVSASRARLGTIQSRLEFTLAHLQPVDARPSTSSGSLAESRIREAEVALETVHRLRRQISQPGHNLAQAQANVRPQAVLGLLV